MRRSLVQCEALLAVLPINGGLVVELFHARCSPPYGSVLKVCC